MQLIFKWKNNITFFTFKIFAAVPIDIAKTL